MTNVFKSVLQRQGMFLASHELQFLSMLLIFRIGDLSARFYMDALKMQNSDFLMELNIQNSKFHVVPTLGNLILADDKAVGCS